jgi:hypothetical protein
LHVPMCVMFLSVFPLHPPFFLFFHVA